MRKYLPCAAILVVLFGLACGPSDDAQTQKEPANMNKMHSKTVTETKTTYNIRERLEFNDKKPAVLSIIDSEKLNLKAVGLKKGQVMPKHKSGLKSFVIILEGKIEMVIEGETIELNELDTYEIPVNVEHEIRGIQQSIFSLTQKK